MINIKILIPFALFFSINAKIYPKDIECFGVIGDSISAGFSMNSGSISKDFIEYRNEVFSIGRKENYRTLPNIFHQFNPSLNLSKSCASNYETLVSYNHKYNIDCNVAISGALSNHVIFMWEELYFQWLKYNCSNKWKVLTIMIGANDICAYCINGYNETISNYMMNIKQLLDNIYDDSQKIFINFISLFDVGVVLDWQNPKCDIVHILINECTCILGKKSQPDVRNKVNQLYQDINKELYKYINSLDNKRSDIMVKIQPILEKFEIYNRSYLSELDCFHPSVFSNKIMATALWNNMFLEPEQKIKNMEYLLPLYEPTEKDYLR